MEIQGSFGYRASKMMGKLSYPFIGMAIAAILIYVIFRSLTFLTGEVGTVYVIKPAGAELPGFDLKNFETAKKYLK